MLRRALLAAGLILSLATCLLAEQGVVVTKDGSSYEGEIRESDESITVMFRGVETIIPREDVESIRYSANYEAEFRARLAKLKADDAAGRITLAREAFQQRRYDLARQVLTEALRIDPNSREATDLQVIVERQMRLERSPPAGESPPGASKPPPPRAAAPVSERHLLTADDINVIRQKELKPTDNGVRISFRGEVKQRFAEAHNMTFQEFNRLSPVEQAIRIIELGDDEMRALVRIVTDPPALADFKRNVQPIVLSHCATAACHGGPGGGTLVLFSPADSDGLTYTNFYILTQNAARAEGSNPGGMFGTSMRKMIDRANPARSLLLNYGLPTSVAEFDHPLVGGKAIQPAFRNQDDTRYRQIEGWMSASLRRLEPNYGINYKLPGAASQPATEPAD